jgi:hypothetical protein
LVQWDGLFVRLLDARTGQLLREHLGQKRGAHRTRLWRRRQLKSVRPL